MDDLELDFWSKERLNTLIEYLRTGIRTADYKDQFELPEIENLSFWLGAAEQCELSGVHDGGAEDVAIELAEAIHAEFGVRDLVKVSNGGIWLGDLAASESRLVMLQLGIKAIVTIASQEVDPLWAQDGIEYHTVVINSCSSQGEHTLLEQLESCTKFLAAHRPALVCCGSGNGPSVVVCAAMLCLESSGAVSAQQALDLVASKRVYVEIDPADMRDLETFCERHHSTLVSPQLKPTPALAPAAMAIAGSKRAALESGLLHRGLRDVNDSNEIPSASSTPPSSLDDHPPDQVVSPPAPPAHKVGKWATAA
mmetsp:Transcript_10072/g.26100  ORF Transcript_10072/g.26100 Transcript_10072/m.26100 type:complete len:310 (+) Transcript_10072:55-984(+)